jgi:hypothetical protein
MLAPALAERPRVWRSEGLRVHGAVRDCGCLLMQAGYRLD